MDFDLPTTGQYPEDEDWHRELGHYQTWIRKAQAGDEVEIDLPKFPIAFGLFCQACREGQCRDLRALHVTSLDDQDYARKAAHNLQDASEECPDELRSLDYARKAAHNLHDVFEKCPDLRSLTLSGSNIMYRQFAQTMSKGGFQKLETLVLNFCRIRLGSVAPLVKAIETGRLQNLRSLKIYSDINDAGTGQESKLIAGAIALALSKVKCPKLEIVDINPYSCDYSNGEKFVGAISRKKFVHLKVLADTFINLAQYRSLLLLPEEIYVESYKSRESLSTNTRVLNLLKERFESGQVQLSVAKVVVAGPADVGKTCLVTRLVEGEFPMDTRMTNGVKIVRKEESDGLELVYYDFGGQPIYSMTHPLFLRSRAVFVIAFDPRTERSDVEYQSFHHYAFDVLDASPDARMIFVSTKSDAGAAALVPEEEDVLRRMYTWHFAGYFHVSALDGSGLEGLWERITSTAISVIGSITCSLELKDSFIPKSYADMRLTIQRLRAKKKLFLTSEEWKTLGENVNIVGEKRLNQLLELFHSMGEVTCLPSGQIIVDPQMLAEALARVITMEGKYIENARGGYLRHKEFKTVWADFPEELHDGLRDMIHECEIGYPIRDDSCHKYEATLIPSMIFSPGDIIKNDIVAMLEEDNQELQLGPRIEVELSTRSGRLGSRLQAKLRNMTLFGGWWRNGVVVVDVAIFGGIKCAKSFGTVSWLAGEGLVRITTYGTHGNDRLLRRRVLEALGSTLLSEFPGADIVRFDMRCLRGGGKCNKKWPKEDVQQSKDSRLFCSSCDLEYDVGDVADWLFTFFERRRCSEASSRQLLHREAPRDLAPEESLDDKKAAIYESLQNLRHTFEKRDWEKEELCYLLLMHQEEILKAGCAHYGRVELRALWLIYEQESERFAVPFCPHFLPDRIRLDDEIKVGGVSNVDLRAINPCQGELNSLFQLIKEKLQILDPCYNARFLGAIWHGPEEEYVFNIKKNTQKKFDLVRVAEIGTVWVHKEDQQTFNDEYQISLFRSLREEVSDSIEDVKLVLGMMRQDLDQRLSTLQKSMDELPQLMVQLCNLKCPYVFIIISKKEWAKRRKGRPHLNSAVKSAEQIEDFMTRSSELFQACKESMDVLTDSSFWTKTFWLLFGFGKSEVVYFQLLCGLTFKPVVTYKVEAKTYSAWAKRFAAGAGQGCAVLVKLAILWNVGARLAGMFGYPAPTLPKKDLERVQQFLHEVKEATKIEKLEDLSKNGMDFSDLLNLSEFLEDLERKPTKMRQCLNKFDKAELEGMTWKEGLVQQAVDLGKGKKQYTYVSTEEAWRFSCLHEMNVA